MTVSTLLTVTTVFVLDDTARADAAVESRSGAKTVAETADFLKETIVVYLFYNVK